MLLATVGAGALFVILTGLDWRRYGWGSVTLVVVGWTVPALIAALVEPEIRPALAPFWLIASVVSLGHPADWGMLMDQEHVPAELTRRQRWNATVSPWLLIAGIVILVVPPLL